MANKNITINALARMTQAGFRELGSKMDKGFAEVDKKFAEVDKKFAEVDKKFVILTDALTHLARITDDNFRHVFARLDKIREDISDLPTIREELHNLSQRVDRLERKAGAAR